jgi:putative membrane protein
MAVMTTRPTPILLLGATLALLAPQLPPAPVLAQEASAPAAEAEPIDRGEFLVFAHSSAVLQEQASTLAASRDTRPEVKEFAQGMAAFRLEQIARLGDVARAENVTLPEGKQFGHRVVLENLEPLDFLALSRRYAEIQVQALEQEILGYQAAERSQDEVLTRLATETLPQLQDRLEAARAMMQAVEP